MSSRENEDAFVISKVMKGGPEVPGRKRNWREGGVEGEFFNLVLKEEETKKRERE